MSNSDSNSNPINTTSTNTTPTSELLEAARAWGLTHARTLAMDSDIRAAVLAGDEVDWLDYPDLLWEALEIEPDDQEDQETLINAASSAAREEGERVIRELTQEQLFELITSRQADGASPSNSPAGEELMSKSILQLQLADGRIKVTQCEVVDQRTDLVYVKFIWPNPENLLKGAQASLNGQPAAFFGYHSKSREFVQGAPVPIKHVVCVMRFPTPGGSET